MITILTITFLIGLIIYLGHRNQKIKTELTQQNFDENKKIYEDLIEELTVHLRGDDYFIDYNVNFCNCDFTIYSKLTQEKLNFISDQTKRISDVAHKLRGKFSLFYVPQNPTPTTNERTKLTQEKLNFISDQTKRISDVGEKLRVDFSFNYEPKKHPNNQ